ncbi:hybrid sensor histidine kinase/response regulator [Parabacteroides sp. 52]|uniref:hybrid sensor histidine kinase/response regulator transcription factor n=1 Tax=unclassified Parabacteroides TaxID=2649774 RepID=UPI0013D76587|nr:MULTISPECIES: hybrid sensor histidine kinase/response regulator transcription factor [unclassified Parabacteroides]MDH6533609.1 signal transduction histidine kinase/DNA-binding response OmpR family regulator/ligand-binding sensor domain-containing protein [Parabacteroides sp. PM5-20]NDV54361.1 hybrid sensor histidine kinase/response regulator [Parabacteroides sp. 52]
MFRSNLLYLLILLLPFSAIKANTDFFFSHLDVEDGLSQISVLKIFQDSDGYLWFATRNGLSKYDGYEFQIYRNELNNPHSLTDSYIKDIQEDRNKNIWAATQNGLSCIEHLGQSIHRFYPRQIDSLATSDNINLLLSHTDGNIYMLQGTTLFLCHPDIRVSPYKHLDPPSYSFRSIAQNPVSGDIYIGTDNSGLLIYSSDWELKKQLSAREYPMLQSLIHVLLVDKKGLWIGTDEAGICYFDYATGEVTNYNSQNSNLGNNTIRSMTFLNEDSVLIGTFSGLNILNTKDHKVSALSVNLQGQGSLSHYSIHSMLLDKDQTLWIGTYSAGINYHSPYYKQISYIIPQMYTGIMGKGIQDKQGHLWFATEGSGLFFYNPQTHEQKVYPLKPLHHTNYERNILKYIMLSDNPDEILCTTHFGSVYSFSISRETYTLLYDYKENDIYTLYIDRKKRLWIPTITNAHTVVVENGKRTNTFPVNGKMEGLTQTTVIHEIEEDLFLLGGLFNSFTLYNWKTGTKENLLERLPASIQKERLGAITSILSDPSFIWISTTKSGVLKFNRDLQFIKQYLPVDGLTDSYVTSMVIDHKGDIWAATVKEIFRHNRQSDQFLSVKQTDIPQQEFTMCAGTVSSDGIIYFPASRGVLAINPDKMQENPSIPPLYITSIITNNNENIIHQLKESTQKNHFSIRLKAGQNHLMIRYAALNYIHSADNQYMFRIEGIDTDWQAVGGRREAHYNNLQPGTYTFRVKAANNDGRWNPEETTLTITVAPPIYKTWWAYTLYILIALTLAYQIYRYQHRKHELERDIRYRQKEQERMKELHDERLRMFTNFAHELRTPLTLIINPLEEVMQNVSFSQEIKQALKRMKKNTQRMLMLVNNLMDIQKYEAGDSKLHKKTFDFSACIQETFQSFIHIAERRKVSFTLQNELPTNYLVRYDETEIEKVFFNLLSNAFKFTPAQGQVTLCIRQATPGDKENKIEDKPAIYIEVKDSGKGFSREEGMKIFEPFYQFKKDVHQEISGTGIGLSLTRSIVEMHQGVIWAESNEIATRFMILLPDTEQQEEIHKPQTAFTEITQKTHILLEEIEAHRKQTLLIVDDDSEIRDYLKQELENEYKVICATNGREALEIVHTTQPNLVITDVVMPEMNGVELCRQIKNTEEYRSISVILLTAKSSVSQIEEGLDIGADDYITKPFQITILKARIRNLLAATRHKTVTSDTSPILHILGINPETMKDDFLNQYIEIVKTNISNHELDISFIYNQLGMSRANFYRKVKTLTGLSPVELIRNIRLEVGAQLLRETNLNISEVAQKTGFASRSYFARNFKSVYGLSPTAYQEKEKK